MTTSVSACAQVEQQRESRRLYHHLWHSAGEYYSFSLEKYLQACLEKIYILLRMTFGLWNEDVIKAAAVKDRAARLDPNIFDDNEEHEGVIRAIGMTNTMVWQFYPGE